MQNTLQIDTKTLNIWDFPQKITQFKHFMCRIPQKLGTFDMIFPKNWEIRYLYRVLTNFKQVWRENSEKSGFSTNNNNFRTISAISYVVL